MHFLCLSTALDIRLQTSGQTQRCVLLEVLCNWFWMWLWQSSWREEHERTKYLNEQKALETELIFQPVWPGVAEDCEAEDTSKLGILLEVVLSEWERWKHRKISTSSDSQCPWFSSSQSQSSSLSQSDAVLLAGNAAASCLSLTAQGKPCKNPTLPLTSQ